MGTDGDLEQAFVDLNIPVGNGLKVILGKTVTLMGVEVIEETPTQTGRRAINSSSWKTSRKLALQLAYKWNDKLDTEFVVFNGWDELPDNNNALSFMGRIGYAVDSNTTACRFGLRRSRTN